VDRFLSNFLTSSLITDDQTQTRVFNTVISTVPRATTARHLDKLFLVVIRFSPAVNVISVLETLLEAAFEDTDGHLAADHLSTVWTRIKEVIEMRPELDLNDAVRLCCTVIWWAVRREAGDELIRVIKELVVFIDGNLLDGIVEPLGADEPAAHSLRLLVETVLGQVRGEQECFQLVSFRLLSVINRLSIETRRGLGLVLLTSLCGVSLTDWSSVILIVSLCEPLTDELVDQVFVHMHSDSDLHNILLALKDGNCESLLLAVTNRLLQQQQHSEMNADRWTVVKEIVTSPPRPCFIEVYMNLVLKLASPKDRYEVLASVPVHLLFTTTVGLHRPRPRTQFATHPSTIVDSGYF
jgi:hypothetical protein